MNQWILSLVPHSKQVLRASLVWGLGPFCVEFTFSSCLCFLWTLWFPPAVQKHDKLPSGPGCVRNGIWCQFAHCSEPWKWSSWKKKVKKTISPVMLSCSTPILVPWIWLHFWKLVCLWDVVHLRLGFMNSQKKHKDVFIELFLWEEELLDTSGHQTNQKQNTLALISK